MLGPLPNRIAPGCRFFEDRGCLLSRHQRSNRERKKCRPRRRRLEHRLGRAGFDNRDASIAVRVIVDPLNSTPAGGRQLENNLSVRLSRSSVRPLVGTHATANNIGTPPWKQVGHCLAHRASSVDMTRENRLVVTARQGCSVGASGLVRDRSSPCVTAIGRGVAQTRLVLEPPNDRGSPAAAQNDSGGRQVQPPVSRPTSIFPVARPAFEPTDVNTARTTPLRSGLAPELA